MSNALSLTKQEQQLLSQCEQTVQNGLQTFFEVGNALETIRSQRLYRATHKTFEDYVSAKWDLPRRTAYRFIAAASVVTNLADTRATPRNEAVARELSSLSPDEQKTVWNIALEEHPDGLITAAQLSEIKKRMVSASVTAWQHPQPEEPEPPPPEPPADPLAQLGPADRRKFQTLVHRDWIPEEMALRIVRHDIEERERRKAQRQNKSPGIKLPRMKTEEKAAIIKLAEFAQKRNVDLSTLVTAVTKHPEIIKGRRKK